ncbi:hypothetical protein [Aminobacterium sp. UBA5277]|jgi:hypothetical protein|uniref:hypothetical protein n=1 Tax=Aminobacterium sp. UBA5277 TaxID=1946029 RepID=UPI00257AC71D|nr:hypothetical protein [Aminobacterium sp. UBA5277]
MIPLKRIRFTYFFYVILTFSLSFLLDPIQVCAAPLPNKGNVALVLDDGKQGSSTFFVEAEDSIRKELIKEGHRVVDEKKLAEIRKSKAALLALEGNVEAIKSLGNKYGVRYFIRGQVSLHEARKNDANLFTATAVITVKGYNASGQYFFSDTVEGREVGYTAEDAQHRALIKATQAMTLDLLKGEGTSEDSLKKKTSLEQTELTLNISGVTSFEQANQTLNGCRALQGVQKAKMVAYGGGKATYLIEFYGDAQRFVKLLLDKGYSINIKNISGPLIDASF